MIKRNVIISICILSVFLTACEHKITGSEEQKESTSESVSAVSDTSDTYSGSGNVVELGKFKIELPDDTWTGECSPSFDMVDLDKEGFHSGGDPTVRIFIDNMNIEDSILAAREFLGNAEDTVDFELTAGLYDCTGFSEMVGTKTLIDKVFYAIDDDRTLRFNIFVSDGMDRNNGEVLFLIENTIRNSGFDAVSNESGTGDNNKEIKTFTIDSQEISVTGETYDVGKFTVEVPEGWTACPAYDYAADKDNCDYSVFLILDGNDRGDYGEKPSVYYYYDEEKSVKSYKAFSRKGSDEAEDIIVNIDGTDYEGLEVTGRMASKDVYWTYDRIFIPVTDESCLMIEVSVDSSEFQGVGMDDEKVQLMIAGTSMV